MWTQVAAQAIAVQRTRLIDCDDGRNNEVPVFGGDFNDHLILHHSGKELHLMQNDPNPVDRRLAVACMRHLLTGTAAKMPSGKELSAELRAQPSMQWPFSNLIHRPVESVQLLTVSCRRWRGKGGGRKRRTC